MLKVLVWLLVLANVGFYAWSHGYVGGPPGQEEPERMKRQVNPEAIQVRS
jgi:hypothetical protein